MCGEREYNAQPQGFIHGFRPKRVRNFDLDSEMARFVEQALPPGALQSGDQNYMKKVVAFLRGDEDLFQSGVRGRRGQVPQK